MSLPKNFIIIIITDAFFLQAHLSVDMLQNKSFWLVQQDLMCLCLFFGVTRECYAH